MKHKFMKLCVMMLALALLAGIPCHAASAATVTKFSDVPETFWSYETIMKMTKAGIFRGATEPVNGVGTFLPDKVMTRAEFITASVRAIYPDETKNIVNDQSLWWKGYYTFALQKGIITRTELDSGNLDKPMSREEMAMVMVRCVEKNGERLTSRINQTRIPDYAQIGNYYKEYVLDCFSFGLLCGIDPTGTFAPTKLLTRAEASTVLCRLTDKTMRVDVEGTETSPETETPSSPEAVPPQIPTNAPLPWENGGKQPSQYTWAEFQALNKTQKEAFVDSFGSPEAFEAWQTSVQPSSGSQNSQSSQNKEKMPWETGGKQPSQYTWTEFQALSDVQKEAFIDSFGSLEKFNIWLSSVLPSSGSQSSQNSQDKEKMPWETGGKQPSQYTWAEFQALSEVQKEKFIDSFGSTVAFDKWLSSVLPSSGSQNSPSNEKMPWETGGKQPSQYTWAEFQALTNVQKEAFVDSFGSSEAFEAWQTSVQSSAGSQDGEKMPWETGGKQPSQYTWAEFQALSGKQKDAFISSFGSMEAFNAWQVSVQPSADSSNQGSLPWEKDGKQPSQYTWAEFQALSDEQKEIFIESFGSAEERAQWFKANEP